jgi:hypothetical protein
MGIWMWLVAFWEFVIKGVQPWGAPPEDEQPEHPAEARATTSRPINWVLVTRWFLIGVVIVCLIYEVIVISASNDQESISWVIQVASLRRPLIPFFGGLLCGHFFWQDASDAAFKKRLEAAR